MLKIAMFGHKRVPSREGGIEVVVEELSTRMAALGHPVTCYNRSGHHVSGAEFDESAAGQYRGVRLKTVFTINQKGIAAVSSSFFAGLACAFSSADVVHIHAEGPAFMCWLPKLTGKRVVVTVHGLDWQREKWKHGFASRYIHAGERAAVRFADEIIVLSKNVQQYFLDTYGRETTLIPNGVSSPLLRKPDSIRARFGLDTDSYLLFLGRLVPEKGIHYLLEAFAGVNTDKKLVISGGSSDSDEYVDRLKALAARDPRVILTSFVQGQILDELYSNAYLYVLPSDLEGMPLTLLEAMSHGNCCVVSDIPECADVVERHGVLFPRGDVDALRGCLQTLCDDPRLVASYRAEVTNYIRGKCSWDEVTAQTLALYHRTCRKEHPHEDPARQ